MESINLSTDVQYNPKYPPSNAKKAYIARITGTAKGPQKYEREFLGRDVDLSADDAGLYEKQRGDKKGGYTRWYYVILPHPEHGVIISADCEDELPKIAKNLDSMSIEEAVEVTNLRESEKHEGRMIFDAVAATKKRDVRAEAIQQIRELMDRHNISADEVQS